NCWRALAELRPRYEPAINLKTAKALGLECRRCCSPAPTRRSNSGAFAAARKGANDVADGAHSPRQIAVRGSLLRIIAGSGPHANYHDWFGYCAVDQSTGGLEMCYPFGRNHPREHTLDWLAHRL